MTPSVIDLGDHHAVITGGSEGIGYAVARHLSGRCASTTLLARDPQKLTHAADTLGCGWVASDVRALNDAATDHLAQATLLVACAGEMTPGRAHELDMDDYRRQMDINFLGAVNCVQAALPHMIARGSGTVVLVSSTAALLGIYGYSAYGATKAAIAHYGATLRAEHARTGVRIAVAYPPDTETPGLARERTLRPAETEAIVGAISAQSADRVGARLVRGLTRGRSRITFDPITTALVAQRSTVERVFEAYSARTLRHIHPAVADC